MKFLQRSFLFFFFCILMLNVTAWTGQPVSQLHVDGKYLKDAQGNIVNLHGFAQTYSPWFNEQGSKWSNYDVAKCLSYNKGLIDSIMSKGWKMNFMRLHMDPYWSNTPGVSTTGENDISAFSMSRFKTYLATVFIPMARYAISKGMYVVMRPPGVCPENICVGDAYQNYLKQVWGYVAANSYLRNNPGIMFELANEPVNIKKADGTDGSAKDLHDYFQAVVDTMRQYCSNILWIPGTGWQSNYKPYGTYPIQGYNIGYAVHCYPGWYNGTGGAADVNYLDFAKGWADQINPVGNVAPIMVTEMDWAPAKYNASWGKSTTGVAGKTGFGANFKKIADDHKNVSWLFFTDAKYLAQYTNTPPAEGDTCTFLNDPEACPWPCYHWYQDYASVQQPKADYSYLATSDNGSGTFTNPVIQGDFPDPDVKLIGDTYYMVTTSMHNFPGCTLLKSKDLVNWEYCCNPLTKLSSNSEYNLENNSNIYSKGSWANSLMYRNGTFYILFNTFGKGDDAGGYVLSATDPEGTWTLKKISRGYYDPGLLLDEDGTTYVVCGNGNLSVCQLDDDFNTVKETQVVSNFSGIEGSHFFKKDGYYYIYSTCCAWPATQWCFRSTSVFGPYEQLKVFDSDDIHQGAMIQTQSGEWWTMLMRDCGAYGRMPYLLPVKWTDNWPVIGTSGKNAGTYTKPNVGNIQYAKTYLPTTDRFCNYKMGLQWQWNHNPDNSKWSLLERPGYLRMYTAGVSSRLEQARNMLTQRIYGYHSTTLESYGTVKMDIRHMNDGDVAGLSVFQNVYGYIAIKNNGGTKQLIWCQDTVTGSSKITPKTITANVDADSIIYLRAVANINTSKARFYYSTDNVTYTQLGDEMSMVYTLDVFVGNRFGIFNYATKDIGGYVDVDWFTTEPTFEEDTYFDNTFTGYSKETLTATNISFDNSTLEMMPGTNKTISLTATFKDGHTEDISASAKYTISGDNITIGNGSIIANSIGDANIIADYTDPMGNKLSATTTASVTFFPFSASNISTSLYGNNTYTESSRSMTMTLYGQCGWQYNNSVDMSAYKYLVIKFDVTPTCGAKLFMFDSNSIWTKGTTTTLNTKQAIIPLKSLKKDDNSSIDLSKIYIVSFWAGAVGTIDINDMYLTNNSDYSRPTAINGVTADDTDIVDVYNIAGIKIRNKVQKDHAADNLPSGIYIIGNKKVVK
jgi:beta-xylosidase